MQSERTRKRSTVTAAARSAATQRGLRGPVCRHRGSQHAARSADCAEELRGASAKRWRSVAECMHGAKERSQREALAECWRSQREALAEPAGSRWLRKGISAERCAHCALHSSTWCSSDLKDGCPLETCSSQDRDSLPPRVGLRSDAVMSNLLSSPQTPGGTAVSCYATSLPLPLSPSASRPFPVRASVTSLKKKRDEKHSHVLYSPLILRLFSAYSTLILRSTAAAHGAPLSRGAAERRPLRWRHATEVSDRLNLSIPV